MVPNCVVVWPEVNPGELDALMVGVGKCVVDPAEWGKHNDTWSLTTIFLLVCIGMV